MKKLSKVVLGVAAAAAVLGIAKVIVDEVKKSDVDDWDEFDNDDDDETFDDDILFEEQEIQTEKHYVKLSEENVASTEAVKDKDETTVD